MTHRILTVGRSVLGSPHGVLGVGLGASLLWASWPTWGTMAERWSTDPRYAHGYLVPAFALVLLWLRRDRLAGAEPRPSWWGLPLIAVGAALQLAGAYFFYRWFEAVAILPALAGLCVLLGGRVALRWAWPAIGFLVFMLPLPYRLEMALGLPLQRIATLASTYALQTLGFPAVAEGNVIQLDRGPIGVIEACNGLGMLFTFFAMSTGVALVIRRPWLDRLVVIASAVPIALVANVTRITVTGMLHELVGSETANIVFHDLAGWLMMPLALGLLTLELDLLARLLEAPDPEAAPVPIAAVGREAPRRAPRERDAQDRPREEKGRKPSDAIKRALRTP
jgi:exosortase